MMQAATNSSISERGCFATKISALGVFKRCCCWNPFEDFKDYMKGLSMLYFKTHKVEQEWSLVSLSKKYCDCERKKS